MKRLLYILFFLPLAGWGQVILVDSYASTNADGTLVNIHKDNAKRSGQTFTVTNSVIVDSIKFYLAKAGSPTGNMFYNIYDNLTGTYGTNALPSGDSIAVTGTYSVSGLTTSPTFGLVKLSFSSKILLTPGYYGTTVCFFGGDASNYIIINRDGSSPSHSGNVISYTTSWLAANTRDAVFYVYGKGLIKNLSGKVRNDTHKKIAGVAENSIKKIDKLTY